MKGSEQIGKQDEMRGKSEWVNDTYQIGTTYGAFHFWGFWDPTTHLDFNCGAELYHPTTSWKADTLFLHC